MKTKVFSSSAISSPPPPRKTNVSIIALPMTDIAEVLQISFLTLEPRSEAASLTLSCPSRVLTQHSSKGNWRKPA